MLMERKRFLYHFIGQLHIYREREKRLEGNTDKYHQNFIDKINTRLSLLIIFFSNYFTRNQTNVVHSNKQLVFIYP